MRGIVNFSCDCEFGEMAGTWNCYQLRASADALTIRLMSASIAPTAAVRVEHLIENRAAPDLQMTEDDLVVLDRTRSCRPGVGAWATLAS